MQFENQVFLSYAHLDNEMGPEQKQGWVTKFHSTLAAYLDRRLGRKAAIWFDPKLAGNDIFSDEIVDQFPKTALLVSVVSPRYVQSEWCTKEAREFCQTANIRGGVLVGNKSRILKVVLIPPDNEDPLPDPMKLSLGYPFYVLTEQQAPMELDSGFGEEYAQKYNIKIAGLAYDIAQLIKQLEKPPDAIALHTAAITSSKPTVYLAECSYDRRDAREALLSELKLHGYQVLPDAKLPTEEDTFLLEVQKLLANCQLSIHLVGEKYGMVPDGPSDKSVVVLQNEAAMSCCQQAPLARLIWLPEGTRSGSPQQQQFIEALFKDDKLQVGAELIAGDIESLKKEMHSSLQKIEAAAAAAAAKAAAEKAAAAAQGVSSSQPAAVEAATKLVYIICNERDRKATIPLRKLFKQRGIEAQIPAFEGEAAVVRKAHEDLLAQCDGLVLFYGAGDEAWKRSIDSDLRKLPAYRGPKPLLVQYTYLAEPSTADKTDLVDLEEPNLINGLGEYSDALLDPLLAQLTGGKP